MSWWLGVGAGVAMLACVGLLGLWRYRAREAQPGLIQLRGDDEVDPLLRSQVEVSLLPRSGARSEGLAALRDWVSGSSHVANDLFDARQELRALQAYVLDLDNRYLRREEARWITLEVLGLTVGFVAALATLVWAAAEVVGAA